MGRDGCGKIFLPTGRVSDRRDGGSVWGEIVANCGWRTDNGWLGTHRVLTGTLAKEVGGETSRKGEGVGQHSVEMAERGRRTSFQQGFSGKTDRFGWVFRWVAYILMYPRESGGQNRQKIRRIPLLPCPTLPSSPFGKEPAQEMSCKVRLTTCVRPFVGRRDAVGREGAGERAKCRPFLAVGYLGATGLNGRLSHRKCCGFQRNREFFHKN